MLNSPPVRKPSPLQLEYPINKIYDLRPFKALGSEFLEFVMSGVVIDVVIPVLCAFKFCHKCVRDTILHNAIVPHEKPFWEKSEHTWSPSCELSVPPDADLIYGFLEVG
jgi:hypothetical protein